MLPLHPAHNTWKEPFNSFHNAEKSQLYIYANQSTLKEMKQIHGGLLVMMTVYYSSFRGPHLSLLFVGFSEAAGGPLWETGCWTRWAWFGKVFSYILKN